MFASSPDVPRRLSLECGRLVSEDRANYRAIFKVFKNSSCVNLLRVIRVLKLMGETLQC